MIEMWVVFVAFKDILYSCHRGYLDLLSMFVSIYALPSRTTFY